MQVTLDLTSMSKSLDNTKSPCLSCINKTSWIDRFNNTTIYHYCTKQEMLNVNVPLNLILNCTVYQCCNLH